MYFFIILTIVPGNWYVWWIYLFVCLIYNLYFIDWWFLYNVYYIIILYHYFNFIMLFYLFINNYLKRSFKCIHIFAKSRQEK